MLKVPNIALNIHASHRVRRDFLRGVARYARLRGPWNLTPSDEEHGLSVKQIRQENFHGIIGDISREMAEFALDSQIAVVATNPFPADMGPEDVRSKLSAVNFDTADKIAVLAIDHFVERKFQRFGFVGFDGVSWSIHREKEFVSLLSGAGYECTVFRQSKLVRDRGLEVEQPILTKWIEQLPKPIAILACNDDRGRQVLDACVLAGVRVPAEVAVLGVDNDDVFCNMANPPLSSVMLNADVAGYRAGELLDGLMNGTILVPRRIDIEAVGIITRLSTDSVALTEPDVAAAMKYIRERHGIDVTVDDLANELRLSRRTLQKLFRKFAGRTVFEEIQLARLEYSKQLLLETTQPIGEIAVQAGFGTKDYFVQFFRRRVGRSPRKFRDARGA